MASNVTDEMRIPPWRESPFVMMMIKEEEELRKPIQDHFQDG